MLRRLIYLRQAVYLIARLKLELLKHIPFCLLDIKLVTWSEHKVFHPLTFMENERMYKEYL